MVWNRSEPTDVTLIRNLGTVIRPNWDAIEDGSTSFQPNAFILTDRNPLAVTDDPPAATSGGSSRGNGYTLYCKQDSSGNQELYGRSTNGDINQFTRGAATLNQTGRLFIPGGLLMQWNRVTASSGSTVTFPVAFGSAPFFVNFVPTGTSGNNRIFTRLSGNPTASSFSPIILNNTGSGITETIYYLALGVPS